MTGKSYLLRRKKMTNGIVAIMLLTFQLFCIIFVIQPLACFIIIDYAIKIKIETLPLGHGTMADG